jgi:hypothetical protein
MPKKGVRVVITGKPRPTIDVDAMTHVIIALGREFAKRKAAKVKPASDRMMSP